MCDFLGERRKCWGKWSSAASSGDRWDGCENQVMFDTQAHVEKLPVQARSNGLKREKEMERRECCTHTLDSECWLSDSGSRWLEAEGNRFPREMLGGVMAMTHQGRTRIRRTMTNGQMRRRVLLRDTEELLGQLERNMATRYSDPAMSLRNGSENTRRTTAVHTPREMEGVK